MSRKLGSLLDNSSDAEHAPLYSTSGSNWIGIEIECLFPRRDNSSDDQDDDTCEYCNDTGEVTCHNCDGEGYLNLEDDNNNEYRVSCADCDGNGHSECPECDGNSSRPSSTNSNSIQGEIRTELRRAGVTLCSVKSDGSLSGDGLIGAEVTLLLDASKGFDKLYKVCKILNDLGAEVNSTCGLHVHLDHRRSSKVQIKQVAQRFKMALPIMSKLVPKSRRSNTYCRLGVSKLRGERYFAINLTSLEKHGTIEIRLHSGSTDARKIENWSRLLLAIQSSRTSRPLETVKDLIDVVSIPEALAEYLENRFAKFNRVESISDDESRGVDQPLEGVA